MTSQADKTKIKEAIKEIIYQEPEFIDELIKVIKSSLDKRNGNRLDKIIEDNFREYESVFKALA